MALTVAVTGPTGDIGISAVEALEWLHIGRTSVVMDTAKAKSQLAWMPRYTAAETLSALGEAI